MPDKVKSVADVVRSIPDGSHIALGGFAIARNSTVFAHEVIRQQKKNLTLSQGVMGFETDLIVGAGLAKKIIVGGGSLDRFGPARCINRARDIGSVEHIDLSSLSLSFMYLAGALGITFIPIKSLMASEMFDRFEKTAAEYIRKGKCPFTGEEYVFLRALQPDVSVVHVQIADREGNCWINGPRWESEEQAKSAKRLIVSAEELVPTEYIQRQPERTIIPGHRVEAVVYQPYGGHPTGVFGSYDYDSDHLKLYAEAHKTADGMKAYIDKYILGTKDHWEYMEKVGGMIKMDEIKAEAIWGY